MPSTTNLGLTKIASASEAIGVQFPDEYNDNLDKIDGVISGDNTLSGDNTFSGAVNFTGTISKNGTPLTPTAAEINRLSGVTDNIQTQIDEANDGISALNQSFAQSYTVKTATNAYGTMVNRYVKIGKLVIGQVDVTPNQAIGTSVGDFADVTDAPPAVTTTCTVHLVSSTEQKTQYVIMRPSRTWAAYGSYTANSTVSGVYCYMTS